MPRARTTAGRRRFWSIVAAAGSVATVLVVAAGPVGASSGDVYPPTPADDTVHAAATTNRPCGSNTDKTQSQLEGYLDKDSVNRGDNVGLHVRAVDNAINMIDVSVYRIGPTGLGNAVLSINNLTTNLVAAPDPTPNPATGVVDAGWPVIATIQTTATWTSGVYQINLTTTPGHGPATTGNVLLVVRDDASSSKILYVLPTASYQAANDWGGKSLNEFSSTGATVTALAGEAGSKRAIEVSFNRPYCSNQGLGPFAGTDKFMVNWLEANGYDVSYATSTDLETNANVLANHQVFVSSYNDQYYSSGMRTHLESALAAGKNLAFFGAANIYNRIRWTNGNRDIQAYKNNTLEPNAAPDKTGLWRDVTGANNPEIKVLGSELDNDIGYPATQPWVVAGDTSFLYQGTGLHNGDSIPNLVGAQFDTVDKFAAQGPPAGLVKVSNSPININGITGTQQGTTYTAASGGRVFDAGTNWWPFVLTGAAGAPWTKDPRVETMTRNVLAQFGGGGTLGASAGYWMVGSDGKVYAFGAAGAFGDAPVAGAAVDLEPNPAFTGYWVVDDLGHVYALGQARGDLGNADLTQDQLDAGERVTSLSATPSGNGYWIFTNRGRVFAKGDAQAFGDLTAIPLNGPVLDSIPTPSGKGYYMVASDGGIFAFGDAVFFGSMGGTILNAPVQSLVPTASGKGYWLVASDGGIFAFGDAGFKGSLGSTPLNKPITGMVRYGDGYLMVGEDGGIFDFSSTPFLGSLGNNPPANPIVSVAAQGT
jgi:hypothetical protein